MLEDAIELLIHDLPFSEALEYCADQNELTRILESIAENMTCTAAA